VDHHGIEHPVLVFGRVPFSGHRGLLDRQPDRDVSQPEVVGRGLVGQHVWDYTPPDEFGKHIGDVAEQPNRKRFFVLPGCLD
jgi:hypothetical protein